jgi:integrase
VQLNSLARAVVEEMWAARVGEHPYVFPGRRGGQPMVNPTKPFAAACKAAGIEGATLHTLRHTFASLCVSSGATLYDVQRLLGHASPTTTTRYAHLQADAARRAAESVAERIGQAGAKPEAAEEKAA